MKSNRFFLIVLIMGASSIFAQQNIDNLLAAGVEDAKRFSSAYLRPATEGIMHSMNLGWFNEAKTKKMLRFEISLVTNVAFVGDDEQSFVLNTNDYENLQFEDGSIEKEVATAFGDIDGVRVEITGESNVPLIPSQNAVFELPTGLGDANINFVPTAFLQARFSPLKGTELKARFFPRINTNEVKVGFYGVGLQHDFTSWLPADKVIPVVISGLVAYTHLDGSYDFTNTSIVDGENQKFENNTNTILLQLIGGTKLPLFNVYGGIGYLTGTSTTDLKGVYRVQSGIISQEQIVDPFSIEHKDSGIRATVGARVSVGFFKVNLDYTLAKYNGLSFGLHFGI